MDVNNELGELLRALRAQLPVAQTGLPDIGERRVPGLRREEVALLAGVSSDYYTRLEQGRERHPSQQVLEAVSRALQLNAATAQYLARLAQPPMSTAAALSPSTVSQELRDLIDRGVQGPATVTGPALDVLAANRLAEALYAGFSRFDNLMRMIFLDPFAPQFYVDWEQAARGVVSNFRLGSAAFAEDPRVTAVVGELTVRSPAFVDYWARYEVGPKTRERKALRHPGVGEIQLDYQAFAVSDAPGQQLFIYTAPSGTTSADALLLLARTRPANHHLHPTETPNPDRSPFT